MGERKLYDADAVNPLMPLVREHWRERSDGKWQHRTAFIVCDISDAYAVEWIVQAATAAEREACARACDNCTECEHHDQWSPGQSCGCVELAAAIRARADDGEGETDAKQ